MARPWMPLYVADYRGKTAHLSALEHGIYLLLIMHYWQTGGLPDDDKQLARIACATDTEWRRARPVVERFFEPGWKHRRVDEELGKAKQISSKRSDAAFQKHSNSYASASANAEQMHTQLQPPPQPPNNFKRNGVGKSWAPPRHGATGNGRIYIEVGHQDWSAYAEDFRRVHGYDPTPNQHGGKWFKVLGESSPDQQELRGIRAQLKAI